MVLPAAELYPGIELLLVEADGKLIGLAPVRRTHHWRKVPAKTLAVCLHQDAFLGTPLLDPDAACEAIGAVIDDAAENGCGLLALEWFGTNGPAQRALQTVLFERGIRAQVYEQADRAALVRRPENDYMNGLLSKGRRRELKRVRRQLCEHLEGDIEVHDRAGDPTAIDGFLRAEASGWKGRAGTNFGASEAYTRFFRRLCDEFDSEGRLELLVMSAAGVDVAWKVNIRSGDTIFCFKIAHDEAFARFSPGVQLELDNVEHFHRGSATRSDSCAAPDNAMINRLWPDRRSYATVLVPTGGLRGLTAKHKARTTIALRRRVRRNDEQAARVR